jgi:hypothetical protein|nr:MAG TPA: hypothetical protein [Caudoviricetes sp.]
MFGMTGLTSKLSGSHSKEKSKTQESSYTTQFRSELLDALNEAALDNLDAYSDLINTEDPRATGAYDTLGQLAEGGNIDVDAIMAAAKQQSDEALGQSYQDLARSVGAADNSLVQAFYDEAVTNAATQLAGKRAELEAQAGNQQLNASQVLLNSLAQDESISLEALNSLLNVLKGAETKSQRTSTTSKSGHQLSGGIEGQFGPRGLF